MHKKLYGIGYQQLALGDFFRILRKGGVQCVLDIRARSFSRRPEFRGYSLGKVCTENGLLYRHEPRLGIDKEIRASYLPNRREELFLVYKKVILPQARDLIDNICELIESRSTVLLCYERESHLCHRKVLGEVICDRVSATYQELRNELHVAGLRTACVGEDVSSPVA
ncbi:MAG: DUF488 domain-containing protein [Thermoguttaceae bacterium]|nr:DUF488 domain-containing protein [Thermoguttaceae bacterium]MDW8080243.1 DUF488 domain-containing protein [Thermoguttaceae bacterium]